MALDSLPAPEPDDQPPRPMPPSGYIRIGLHGDAGAVMHVPFWLPPGITPDMVRVRDVGPPPCAVHRDGVP